jgi:hypothetical protein
VTGGTETLFVVAALIGAAAIWTAYGGAVRGWLSTRHLAYGVLSIGGTILVVLGLGVGVGIGPTTALAAGLAIALTTARWVLSR